MYDELVKRLREAPSDWPDAELHYEAANAIEELSRELIELKLLTCCCTEPPKNVHNCFETIDTPIRDYMVNPKEKT